MFSKEKFAEIKDMHQLADIFKSIIQISLKNSNLISTEVDMYNMRLNESKEKVLRCMVNILQFFEDSREDLSGKLAENEDIYDSPFISVLNSVLEPLVKSVYSIINDPDHDEFLQSDSISNLMNEVLLILTKLTYDARFLDFYLNNHKSIFVEILLPIIISSQNDLEKFEHFPEEFLMITKDLCEINQSDTYKITAAMLLKAFANKIDGSLSFMVTFVAQLIDKTILKASTDVFTYLMDFRSAQIFNSQESLIIEGCLTVLCILSSHIKKRSDLSGLIDIIIGSHYSIFALTTDPLIQNRVCLIVHHYGGSIFAHDTASFIQLVQILLNCCNPCNTSKATNLQACETLSCILQEESICIRLEALLSSIILSFVHLIPVQTNKEFFEAIQELITGNTDLVFPNLGVFISALVQKVQTEVETKNKDKSLIITKC